MFCHTERLRNSPLRLKLVLSDSAIGTLASGLTYHIGGLPLMLAIAAGMVALSAMAVSFLVPEEETMG